MEQSSCEWRIEAAFLPDAFDAEGARVLKAVREDLGVKSVRGVSVIDAYSVSNSGLTGAEIKIVAERLFCDPVVQRFSVNAPLASGCGWVVEVGFKPGVTDSVGLTCRIGIRDVLKKKLPAGCVVRTSKVYCIQGALSASGVEGICRGLLANELIQGYSFKKGK